MTPKMRKVFFVLIVEAIEAQRFKIMEISIFGNGKKGVDDIVKKSSFFREDANTTPLFL